MENIKNQKNQKSNQGDFRLVKKSNLKDLRYTQIINTISHELSTPVSILKSNIQMFKDFSFNVDQAIKDESIHMCEESVENVVRFLDNIQLLNTAIRSEIIPSYSSFKVKNVMYSQFKEMARLNLQYSRISIQWDLAVKVIFSDLLLLRQIVANLLSNALKFSKEKVFLFISTTPKQISIVVQDSGIGIPKEELAMVCNPFFRSTNAKKKPGVGLGLAIVSTLTKSMRGHLYVSSIIDQGTTVKILLPYEN